MDLIKYLYNLYLENLKKMDYRINGVCWQIHLIKNLKKLQELENSAEKDGTTISTQKLAEILGVWKKIWN